MNKDLGFKIRFRFRVRNGFHINEIEHQFKVRGRIVTLKAPDKGAISQSNWLIMSVEGFESEEEAREFAGHLKAATDLSSVTVRIGVDSGIDAATSSISQFVRDKMLESQGVSVRDNVHGIDVFRDGNVSIFSMQATGKLLNGHEPFLGNIDKFFDSVGAMSSKAKDIVLLLNFALMTPDPVAQIIFAFSAVEMLGQDEEWSQQQRILIDHLADRALADTACGKVERQEVSERIKKGLQKVGLRQGVMRLLDDAGLGDLKGEWDKLYSERSTLVHGLAPKPGVNYSEFARQTINLCARILIKLLAKEIPRADQHLDVYYKL